MLVIHIFTLDEVSSSNLRNLRIEFASIEDLDTDVSVSFI